MLNGVICNLYRIKGNTEPSTLIRSLGASSQGLLWTDDWVMPFTRPLMPIVLDSPRRVVLGSWTLMPGWVRSDDAAGIKKQSRMTANARSETLFELPSFKPSAVTRRCLVLASEFREWQWQDTKGRVKVPFDIRFADSRPFLMAGLYSEWNGLTTYTIVTKPANALMAGIHNGVRAHSGEVDPRMPVLIAPDEVEAWLRPGPRQDVEHFFLPRDDDGLVGVPEKKPGTLDFDDPT